MANSPVIYLLLIPWFVVFSAVRSSLMYDFESQEVPEEISSSLGSAVELNTSKFKNGSKSLKWQWAAGDKLTWDLSSRNIKSKKGGIKIWIYNSNDLPKKCLSVCFCEKRRRSTRVSCFPLSLNFQGWRIVVVAYKEFSGCPATSSSPSFFHPPSNHKGWKINQFTLTAPSDTTTAGPLYIDMLRFVDKLTSKVSRDSIVPPLTYNTTSGRFCTSCEKVSSGLSEAEAEPPYGYRRRSYWTHIYRWSLRSPPTLPATVDTTKLAQINGIAQRLMNWYANKNTIFTRIPHRLFPEDSFLMHRWDSLLRNIHKAHEWFTTFTTGGKLTSGLFIKDRQVRNPIFYDVLLPFSLEHYIKSRDSEVDHASCLFATKYNCSHEKSLVDKDTEAITGKQRDLQEVFQSHYSPSSVPSGGQVNESCSPVNQACFDHVKLMINAVNQRRKEKIIKLFDYIKEQGFDKGSALGTMDHALLGMSGFFHSAFLMRNELRSARKLNRTMEAMKWYTEFGEIYQRRFEYSGTTADRARTLFLFRLMTVLVMPEDNNLQKRKKIRDMQSLKLWIENSLTINEGLGGFIKPDFTCFHHKGIYASAYCPSALHTAALISYLLQGTDYQLKSEVRKNLVNALKVFRIVAVRYSTPSAVGGRFLDYTRAIFAKHMPAYAYIAANPGKVTSSTILRETSLNMNLSEVRMFLRLYNHTTDTCKGTLNKRLCKGTVSRVYYLNTLGSLEIMDKVKALAAKDVSTLETEAEPSPEGHWSKQFAALSIHRREDWAVTVKGFDKFVWDYETIVSRNENPYGMYASHGAMLIANSESALKFKDVENGWDWRKIPGTTVVNAPFSKMLLDNSRHLQQFNNAMAGGVTFGGSTPAAEGIIGMNGVFGMNFVQPPNISKYFSQVSFRFKKSVFFYDDVIVALGSKIEYSGGRDEVHTTLFQDNMRATPSPKLNTTDVFRCNDGGNLEKSSWNNSDLVTLVDVNGNRYYIPKPNDQGLVFKRNKTQISVKENGDRSQGIYCTAWFNHGTRPSASKEQYEYAVQVEAEPVGETRMKTFLNLNATYNVTKKDNEAHVVKFLNATDSGTVHGYVVFPVAPTSAVDLSASGPVTSVSNQSIIMVEENTSQDRLYMSVTSPQLNLMEKNGSPSWCQGGTTSPVTASNVEETLLFCAKSKAQELHVNLRDTWSTLKSLHVGGKNKWRNQTRYLEEGNLPTRNLRFINLRNGADTEICYENHQTEGNDI